MNKINIKCHFLFPFSYQTFKDIQHPKCLPAYNLYLLFYKYSIRGKQAATVMKHLPEIAKNGAQFTSSIKSKGFLISFLITSQHHLFPFLLRTRSMLTNKFEYQSREEKPIKQYPLSSFN